MMEIEIVDFTKVLPASMYAGGKEYKKVTKSFGVTYFNNDELFVISNVKLQDIKVPHVVFIPVSRLNDFTMTDELRAQLEDEIEIAQLRVEQAKRRNK